MTPTLTFVCSICGEPSSEICVYCTKDACGNHICEKCHRCSDCCECEIRLEERREEVRVPVTAEVTPFNADPIPEMTDPVTALAAVDLVAGESSAEAAAMPQPALEPEVAEIPVVPEDAAPSSVPEGEESAEAGQHEAPEDERPPHA